MFIYISNGLFPFFKLQTHTDALTTIQLASRIHRMRRRKHRFPMGGDKSGVGGLANGMNAGKWSE